MKKKLKQKRQTRKEPVSKRTKELAYDAVNRPASDGRKTTSARTHPSPVMKGRAKRKPVEERVLR